MTYTKKVSIVLLNMVDRDEGRGKVPMRYENPSESLLRLKSLEAQGIFSFAGAGIDYDVFKPHNPGDNTIYSRPLLYATPSVELALFFALVVNNTRVKADTTLKTITCEHSRNGYDLDLYVAAEQRVLDIVDDPNNSGWVAVFNLGDTQGVSRYTSQGREGESATHLPTMPFQLIKVTNEHFPFPVREIPLYSPPQDWTSEQRRKHTPFEIEGFPCFNRPRPFARVFSIPHTSRIYSGSADY